MAKKPRKSDLVDWTLAQAPDPIETPAATPALAQRQHSRLAGAGRLSPRAASQIALILIGLIALPLLALGLSSAWNAYQLRHGVAQVISAEEQSINLGDVEQLDRLYPAGNDSWVAAQLMQAVRGQVAPLPISSLWPASKTGVVESVKTLTPDTAQADVSRRYFAPDGSMAVFTLPQFYHFVNGAWVRMPPPANYHGEVHQWMGRYVDLSYYAVDEPILAEVGPYLDSTLARVCAAWVCPAGVGFDLRFLLDDTTPGRGFDYFAPAPGAPMLFALLLSERETFWSSPTLPLAAPHLAGYPADAKSQDVYRRLLAMEVFLRLVGRVVPDNFRFSAFTYALATRLSAELQLDAPQILDIGFARPAFAAEELWALQYVSTVRPLGPFYTKVAQYDALAAMNVLLAGQPPETEARLFRGLQTANDPATWLAEGLNIAPEQARARLQAGLENVNHLPSASVIPSDQTFTLSCGGGLATFTAGQGQPRYFLAGRFLDAVPIEWSPDRQRLLVELSGQPAVVESATGLITWLPPTPNYYEQILWASNSVLAYTQWPRDLFRTTFDPAQFSLHFFDAADPQRFIAPLTGIQSYALSPDRATAAIVQVSAAPFFSRQGVIALMPALGGALRPIATGLSPAWSPDGRTLLYGRFSADTATLHILDIETGATKRIFNSGDWDRRGQQFDLSASWSPTGERAVLTLRGSYGSHFSVWLLRPDGVNTAMIYDGDAAAYADPARFSADGAFLAVTLWDPYWQRQTAIYNAATGARGVRLPNVGGWPAWAPQGHQLVMSSYEGVALIANPGDPNSQPRSLAQGVCYQVLWNPAG